MTVLTTVRLAVLRVVIALDPQAHANAFMACSIVAGHHRQCRSHAMMPSSMVISCREAHGYAHSNASGGGCHSL